MRASTIKRGARVLLASAAVLALTATGATASPVKIAYEKDSPSEQTWVVNANGTGRKDLGAGEQPLISPNGRMVAASNFGPHGYALIVYSTAGQPKQHYINVARNAATALAWSPDSRYIAVQLTDTTTTATATNPGDGGVVVVDTRTRTAKRVAAGFVFGASFDPSVNATDRLAYGVSPKHNLNAPDDIYTINADGTGATRITHDGRSLNPVWGPHGIAYDLERFRGNNAPDYNISLMAGDGTHRRQITHVHAGLLVEGLVPLAFSANGNRMIAEYVGEDTSEGYTVTVSRHSASPITVAHHSSVNADGISRSGTTLLVTLDAFENPTSAGKVATIPFSGSRPILRARHAGFAVWNG